MSEFQGIIVCLALLLFFSTGCSGKYTNVLDTQTNIVTEEPSTDDPSSPTLIQTLSASLATNLVSSGLSQQQANKIAEAAALAAQQGTASVSQKIMRKISGKITAAEDITVVMPLISKGAIESLNGLEIASSAGKADIVDEVVASTTKLIEGKTSGLTDAEVLTMIEDTSRSSTTAIMNINLSESDVSSAAEKVSAEMTANLDEAGVSESVLVEAVAVVTSGSVEAVMDSSASDAAKEILVSKPSEGAIKAFPRAKMNTAAQMSAPMRNVAKGAIRGFKRHTMSAERLAAYSKIVAEKSIGSIEQTGVSADAVVELSENISSGAVAGLGDLLQNNEESKAEAIDQITHGSLKGLQNCNLTQARKTEASEKVVQGAMSGLQNAGFDKAKIQNFSENVMAGAIKSIDNCAACATDISVRDSFMQKIAASGSSALNMFEYTPAEKADMMAKISYGAVRGLARTQLSAAAMVEAAQSISTGAVKGAGSLALNASDLATTVSKINEGSMVGLDKAIVSGSDVSEGVKKVVLGSVIAMKDIGLNSDQITAITKSVAEGSTAAIGKMGRFSGQLTGTPSTELKNVVSSISKGALAGAARVLPSTYLADAASVVAVGSSAGLSVVSSDSALKTTLMDEVKTGASAGILEEASLTTATQELKDSSVSIASNVESNVQAITTDPSTYQEKFADSLNNTTVFVPYVKRLELFVPAFYRIFPEFMYVGSCQPGSNVYISLVVGSTSQNALEVKCLDSVGIYQIRANELSGYAGLANGAPFALAVKQLNQLSVLRPFYKYQPLTSITTTLISSTTLVQAEASVKILGPVANTQVEDFMYLGIGCKPNESVTIKLLKADNQLGSLSGVCSLSSNFALKFGAIQGFSSLAVGEAFSVKVEQGTASHAMDYVKRASTITTSTTNTATIILKITQPASGELVSSASAIAGDCSHNMRLGLYKGEATVPSEQSVACVSGHFNLAFGNVVGFSSLLNGESFGISMRPEIVSGYPPPMIFFKDETSGSNTTSTSNLAFNYPAENSAVTAGSGLSIKCSVGVSTSVQLSSAAKNILGAPISSVCSSSGSLGISMGSIPGFSLLAPNDAFDLSLKEANSTSTAVRRFVVYQVPLSTTQQLNPLFNNPPEGSSVTASTGISIGCAAAQSGIFAIRTLATNTSTGVVYGGTKFTCSSTSSLNLSFGNFYGFSNLSPGTQFQVVIKGTADNSTEVTRNYVVYSGTTTSNTTTTGSTQTVSFASNTEAAGALITSTSQLSLSCTPGMYLRIQIVEATGMTFSPISPICSSSGTFMIPIVNIPGFANLMPGANFTVYVGGVDSTVLKISRIFKK